MSQKFSTEITVGNNSELGFDYVKATTSCLGFIDLEIPGQKRIELKRKDMIDFLLRTQPEFSIGLKVSAEMPNV